MPHQGRFKKALLPAADGYVVEIVYGDPVTAYRMGWYPGAEHAGPRRIRFKAADYFDVLRMLNFVT